MRILEETNNFWDELAYWIDEPGFAYHRGGWREQFSHLADFDALDELLVPSGGKTVGFIPCPLRDGCPDCLHLRVRTQQSGEYIGVCPRGHTAPLSLNATDLRPMRFRCEAFHVRVAATLPIEPDVRPGNAAGTWLLGTFRLGTRVCGRLYISYLMPGYMLECCSRLMAADNSPCVVLSPHFDKTDENIRSTLNALPVTYVPIQEVIAVDRQCRPSLISPPHPVIQRFIREEIVVDKIAGGFPLPTGSRWEDIHLHFLDLHTVSCTVGLSHPTFAYQEMGMKDARTGDPDANWKLLLFLAENNGMLAPAWSGNQISSRDRQKKRRLSAVLKQFFHLETDPFVFDCDHSAYIPRFKISPESRSTTYHRRLRER